MIELYVYDINFKRQGEISKYQLLEIERNYNKVSSLTLTLDATLPNIDLLQQGRILTTKKDKTYGYYIENIFYTAMSMTIEVQAYSLNYFLSWRDILKLHFQGNIEDAIKYFINKCCISTDANRIIPKLRLAPGSGLSETVDSVAEEINLYEHVFPLANAHEATIDILMNNSDKTFDVHVWKGTDRSRLQSVNPRITFSEIYDNLTNQSYTNSLTDWKTTVIIKGEQREDGTIVYERINDELSGFNRREVLHRSSLTSNFTDEGGSQKQVNEGTYRDMLREEGEALLQNDYRKVETFEGEILETQWVFGEDYNLGDKVSVKDQMIGKIVHPRIEMVKVTSSREGTTILPMLGEAIPDTYERLMKKVKR